MKRQVVFFDKLAALVSVGTAVVGILAVAVLYGCHPGQLVAQTADNIESAVVGIEADPAPTAAQVEPIALGEPTIVMPNTEIALEVRAEIGDDYLEFTLEDGRRLRIRDLQTGVAWHIVSDRCGVQSGEWHVREREFYSLMYSDVDRIVMLPTPVAADIRTALDATCPE